MGPERSPTLPSTVDGKVNVRAITLALGRPQSQEQHFFKKPELRSAINAVAIEQGLKAVGDRHSANAHDATADERVRRAKNRSDELARLVAEQALVISEQRKEILSLREQLKLFYEVGQVIRTGLLR